MRDHSGSTRNLTHPTRDDSFSFVAGSVTDRVGGGTVERGRVRINQLPKAQTEVAPPTCATDSARVAAVGEGEGGSPEGNEEGDHGDRHRGGGMGDSELHLGTSWSGHYRDFFVCFGGCGLTRIYRFTERPGRYG